MAFKVVTTLKIGGDRTLVERASKNLRNTKKFLRQVGVLGLSSGARRLATILAQKPEGQAARTGRLAQSLTGAGARGNVFRLSDFEVVVGTNVHYAAQLQFGGTILPRNVKALAIPVTPQLKRAQLSPSDIDPTRELLQFVPFRSKGKPNVIGGLIDEGETDTQLKGRRDQSAKARRRNKSTPYGPGLLYVLVTSVTQQARPFLFWSDDDTRVIREELFPQWVKGT